MFQPCVNKYYDLNRMLLLVSGLWPYQKSMFRHMQAAFFLAVLLSFIGSQLTIFLSTDCNINLIMKVFSIVLPTFVCVMKYNTFFFNVDKMRLLMDLMWYHWTIIQDKQEIAILERYTRFTRQFTVISLQIFSSGIVFVTIGHCMPIILDIVVPLNMSRPREFYILTEYFVDQEKYFFLILLHIMVSLSVGSTVVLSVGTMIMAYMQHACAMLKIASYRIGNAAGKNFEETLSSRDRTICEKIISGVHIHREAIKFTDLILSDFKVPYLIVIAVGVASLALNMFQVLTALMKSDASEILISVMFIIVQFFYLYVASYFGQIVADHYAEVFDATCYSYWYTTPLSAQRLLLFIMKRTSKNFYFVFGGIYAVSLKGFSSLASMSVSYFTVIYSMMYSK